MPASSWNVGKLPTSIGYIAGFLNQQLCETTIVTRPSSHCIARFCEWKLVHNIIVIISNYDYRSRIRWNMISEWNEGRSLRVGYGHGKIKHFCEKLPYPTHTHRFTFHPLPFPTRNASTLWFWLFINKLLKFTSSRANQLMVHCWFGARCFGILGVPWKSLSNNLFHKGIPNFQTTRPQITHLPLVEQTWRKNNHHPNLHGLAPIHPVTGDFSNAQVTWPRRKYS